jgi:PPM family protein phosphatase
MKRFVEAYVISNVGRVRPSNQDNFIFHGSISGVEHDQVQKNYTMIFDETSVFSTGVFDGMGGESHGDIASHIAAKEYQDFEILSLSNLLKSDEIIEALQEYYQKANQSVCHECRIQKSRMGTTASILVLNGNEAIISNIGDSRIYRVRDGNISLLTKDHTENMTLISNNINPSNKKGRLTQYLGIFENEYIIEPYFNVQSICEDDIYFICSDGVTDMLTDYEIEGLINESTDIQQAISRLVEFALEKGGVDNITAIVVSVKNCN